MESAVKQHGDLAAARPAILREWTSALGLKEGMNGRLILGENRMKPEEFSIKNLAESIFGNQFKRLFDPNRGSAIHMEAAIDPSAMVNINLFSAVTAGLVMAKVLEQYNRANFIGDELVEIVPTKKIAEKFIGHTDIQGFNSTTTERKPGQPHNSVQFAERWVDTQETREYSAKIEVTQEVVFFDLTGQILEAAGNLGFAIRYERDEKIGRTVMGVDNHYKFDGTAYNTYQTASPWINAFANAPTNWKNINTALSYFRKLKEPFSNRRIVVEPTTIICHTDSKMLFEQITEPREIRTGTDSNATQHYWPNPIKQPYKILSSTIFDGIMEDSTGLNLSTNAVNNWFFGDFTTAFKWLENWPLRIVPMNPSEYVMTDKGIVAGYFVGHRGNPAVKDPRYVQWNKHA